jgi:hypothetical protein
MQRLAPGPHRDNLNPSPVMLSSAGDCICQRAGPTIRGAAGRPVTCSDRSTAVRVKGHVNVAVGTGHARETRDVVGTDHAGDPPGLRPERGFVIKPRLGIAMLRPAHPPQHETPG